MSHRVASDFGSRIPLPIHCGVSVVHWSEVSENPNLPDVLNLRASRLSNARKQPVDDRINYLCSLARDKRMLDVGVVNHLVDASQDPNWLHGRLSAVASYCLGVDVVAEGVRRLRETGYNVVLCDITSKPEEILGGPFELMVCGELVEHLGNPKGLFDAARRLLVPGGRLVLTSPNPFYLGRIFRHLFNASRENVDHVTMLFPSGVAELADRAGLELAEYRGIYPEPVTAKRKLFLPIKWMVQATMGAEAACDSIIYECTTA